MASTGASFERYVSPMTLAAFADSGWYSVDYAQATTLRAPFAWGYKRGCDFATNACLTNGKVTEPAAARSNHFCAVPSEMGCSVGHKSLAQCNMATYVDHIKTMKGTVFTRV